MKDQLSSDIFDGKTVVLLGSLLIGVPLFVYTLANTDISRTREILGSIEITYLGIYLIMSVLTLLTYTLVWQIFLQTHQKVSLSFFTLFNYRMVGFALSYVTPGPRVGGEITRGSLIDKNSRLGQRVGTAAAAMEMLCIFLSGLIFDTAVVCLALILLPQSWLLQITIIALIVIITVTAALWYGFVTQNGARKLLNVVADYVDNPDLNDVLKQQNKNLGEYIKERSVALLTGISLCLLTKVFIATQMYVLLAGLQTPISFLGAVFLAATIDIAYSIPSYMGLGALEAGQSGVISLLIGSASAGVGVLVALITRLRDIAFSGYGLIALSYYVPSYYLKPEERFSDLKTENQSYG